MGTKEVMPQLKKGLWKPEEDLILKKYVETYGEGKWATVSHRAGLMRGGKSCRLRWKNYLRPNIKLGGMSEDEKDLIIRLHKLLGNRWSLIAGRLPGRTDNEVKNYWNTHLNKKCPRGERTRRIDPNNNRNKTPLPRSEPIHSENKKNSSNGGLTKEEDNGSTTVSHSWIEDMKSFFSDIKSPLPMYSEPFFYNDEILMPMMDNYVLFEAFGTNEDQTFQEGMLPPRL
ncbi:unnamed protein product [Ilex paraguariensis]|uniref:Transcription factor MYB82 n=1 Tax=Ilex paraguariensis TaxID=185542 RepID=A0ABC8RK71_9AQUA